MFLSYKIIHLIKVEHLELNIQVIYKGGIHIVHTLFTSERGGSEKIVVQSKICLFTCALRKWPQNSQTVTLMKKVSQKIIIIHKNQSKISRSARSVSLTCKLCHCFYKKCAQHSHISLLYLPYVKVDHCLPHAKGDHYIAVCPARPVRK